MTGSRIGRAEFEVTFGVEQLGIDAQVRLEATAILVFLGRFCQQAHTKVSSSRTLAFEFMMWCKIVRSIGIRMGRKRALFPSWDLCVRTPLVSGRLKSATRRAFK
eukprot:scaffold34626_cov206-Amphora_coffeaeformis.AAC.2